MEECLELSAAGVLNPSFMVTHVGGLGSVPDALMGLPTFAGGKILAYPHAEMELTAIADFGALGAGDARFARLAEICDRHHGIWNQEAEECLLEVFAGQARGRG